MADSHPSTSKHDEYSFSTECSTPKGVVYETFKKRKGTTNKGGAYENLNIANLILNLLTNNNHDSYNISSNHEEYGDFDDIVLENTTPIGIKSSYAIQLKHSDRGALRTVQLASSKGNFSIQKYAGNFKKIKNHNLFQLHLILFTNLKFDISGDDTVITLEDDDNFDIRIKRVQIEQGNLFNTSAENGHFYEFQIEENEKTSAKPSVAEKYRIFFQNFKLYTNQRSADELKENIINKFRNRFCCDETTAKEYLEFVSEWSSVEDEKEKLNDEMVRGAISKLLLSPFLINLTFSDESVDYNSTLLRSAISNFDVTLLHEENSGKIKNMWQDLETNLKNDKETIQIGKRYQCFSSHNRDVRKLQNKEKNLLLWLMGKCPIIVPKTATTSKAIELYPHKKIILLVHDDTNKIRHCKTLHNLTDLKMKLDEKEYNQILDNFKCSLQGKPKITLRELIHGSDNFSKCITVNELVKMLNESFRFGESREQLPIPYIERLISKNTIDFKAIYDIMNNRENQNLIIISCFGRLDKNKHNFARYNIIKIEDYLRNAENKSNDSLRPSNLRQFQKNLKKDIYISHSECSELEMQQICKKNSNKNCHHLQITEDEELEWIQTKGVINDLVKHRKHEHFLEEKNLFGKKNVNNNINIICDDPGMGKSILLKSLKNNYSSTFWVILITPTDISTFINEKNEREEFVDYIVEKKYKRYAVLVRNLNVCNRVVFFWDGLDEVCEENLEFVYSTVEKLAKNGNSQWITSRRHLQFKLEKRFNTFSRKIQEFDVTQQRYYIKKRLSTLENDINETIIKIENCLKVAKFNDILGIPQQIFMLTELFLENSEKYEKLFIGVFSLVELYEHFVEEKISLFFKEKLKLCRNNEYLKKIYKKEKEDEIKRCQQLALFNVFELEILNDLEIELNEKNIESSCIEDLVIKLQDEPFQFVHNSYGEYFAASYLLERYTNMKNLQKYIFKERFRNVRFLFDLMLAKNHPAHIGVLYKNPDIVKKYLRAPEKTDDGGRTLLHLACAWGSTYPLLNYEKDGKIFLIEEDELSSIEEESSDYCSIFEYLTEQNIPDKRDKIFNMSPLDYADKSLCFYPIIKLVERQNVDLTNFENLKDIFRILWYCVKFNYSDIFDVIDNIAEIKTQTKIRRDSILHIAAFFNAFRILREYLKHKKTPNVNVVNALGVTPLYIACAEGHREIVQELIRNKAEVNAANKDGYTPLYIACHEGHGEIVDELIRNKAEVNAANKYGYTPLLIASQKGHRQIVDKLIRNKAKVNGTNEDGYTPLYVACHGGHREIVDKLIKNKAEVNIASKDGYTPLLIACHPGHREIVDKLIINKVEVNAANENGYTPLYVACQEGHREIVKELIRNKAEVNAANKNGYTPLYIACAEGHREIVDELIRNKAKVNIANKDGYTPLLIVCHAGHREIVDEFIRNKAEVDAANKDGCTPLYTACQEGHREIVDELIRNKAEVNAANKDGYTPLYIACHGGHREIVDELIRNKAEVNAANKDGYTPLYIACGKGHREIVDELIRNKAEVNVASKDGCTPLYVACQEGHREIVDKLIRNKAVVNVSSKDGYTPLCSACQKGHREIVDDLIRNKAEVNISNENGATPLYIASQNGHLEIVDDLIKNKAEVNAADKNGYTPLFIASHEGHLEIVDKLIRNKAEVNVASKDGYTPLYTACQKGHREIVDQLNRNNADINRANKDGFTPIYIARLNQHEKIFEQLVKLHTYANPSNNLEPTLLYYACLNGDYDKIDHLIKSGSNVNETDKLGFTPLHIACYYGHRNVIHLLTEAHADVNIADKYGFTPLHAACLNGQLDLVETLIMYNADVNTVDKYGITPFYLACHNGDLSMVQYFINLNADINYPNNYGVTPIQAAVESGHLSIVKMLIDHNVNMNAIDNDGNTPLHEACLNGNSNIAELIIKSGANFNIKNNNNLTPIEIAQRWGYPEIVSLFPANGH